MYYMGVHIILYTRGNSLSVSAFVWSHCIWIIVICLPLIIVIIVLCVPRICEQLARAHECLCSVCARERCEKHDIIRFVKTYLYICTYRGGENCELYVYKTVENTVDVMERRRNHNSYIGNGNGKYIIPPCEGGSPKSVYLLANLW